MAVKTSLKKWIYFSHCFQIHRSYSMLFNLWNVDSEFFWNWILVPKLKKTLENCCLVFTSARKCKIRQFHSPNIHIQILKTDLYTFPLKISEENLIKDQSIFSWVIILLILITSSDDNVWISLGENCCWSLLGLTGLSYL